MKSVLLIILQSIIFALIDVFAKIALKSVPVFTFMSLRFAIAALGASVVFGKKVFPEMKKIKLKYYILPALCQGLAINLSNVALKLTAATTYSFVRSMGALIPPVILCIFYGRKYKKIDFILQVSLLIGLYLLVAKGGFSGFGIGELLSCFVALLCALSLVFAGDSLKYVHSETISTMQIFCGLAISIVFGVTTKAYGQTDVNVLTSSKIILILLFNGLFGTVLGYSLQNIALKKVSAKVVGIAQCAYPVCTAAAAFIILNERMTTTGIIGATIIMACVVTQSILKD